METSSQIFSCHRVYVWVIIQNHFKWHFLTCPGIITMTDRSCIADMKLPLDVVHPNSELCVISGNLPNIRLLPDIRLITWYQAYPDIRHTLISGLIPDIRLFRHPDIRFRPDSKIWYQFERYCILATLFPSFSFFFYVPFSLALPTLMVRNYRPWDLFPLLPSSLSLSCRVVTTPIWAPLPPPPKYWGIHPIAGLVRWFIPSNLLHDSC